MPETVKAYRWAATPISNLPEEMHAAHALSPRIGEWNYRPSEGVFARSHWMAQSNLSPSNYARGLGILTWSRPMRRSLCSSRTRY